MVASYCPWSAEFSQYMKTFFTPYTKGKTPAVMM